MKPNSLRAFSIGLTIGIALCFVILYTQNVIWFFVPALLVTAIWLIYIRRDIRYYLHPKALQANQNGLKCLKLNQYEKAKLFFDASIRLYPTNALAFNNRGLVNAYLDYLDEAISDANNAIGMKKNFANPYTVRAIAYVRKKDYATALKDCNTAITINPKFSFAYLVRGEVYAAQEDNSTAIQDYTRALELVSDKKKSYRAAIYTNIGLAYWYKGDQEKAFSTLDTAIQIAPKSAIAYSYRGYIQSCLGHLEEAFEDCQRAIKLSPSLFHPYDSCGLAHFLKSEYSVALENFQKSEELKPNNKFALVGQAVSYYALNQKDEAKQFWQKLIKIDPDYKDVEALVKDYHPATPFVEVARNLIVELMNN